MNPFKRKTYGRIFVQHQAEVERVKLIIKNLDPFEYEYLPDDLITTVTTATGRENEMIFLHKFEMCKDHLTRECINRGIWIWCVDGKEEGETV